MAEHIERVGRRIRERREELGLTQGELARRLATGNPDAAQVSRWERGIHDPTADRKEELATALETTVADLMAGPRAEHQTNGATPDLLDMSVGRASLDGAMAEQLDRIEQKLDRILERLEPPEAEDVPDALPPPEDHPPDASDAGEAATG